MNMSKLSLRHQYFIALVVVEVMSSGLDAAQIETAVVDGAVFQVRNEPRMFSLQAHFVACAARFAFDEEGEDFAEIWMEVVQFFDSMVFSRTAKESGVFMLYTEQIDMDCAAIEAQGAPR